MRKGGWEQRDQVGQDDHSAVRYGHCGANDISPSPQEGEKIVGVVIHRSQASWKGSGTGFLTSAGTFAELS